MKKVVFALALLFVGVISLQDAFAQSGFTWRVSGGWGMGMPYDKMFNPQTIETRSGEVSAVERIRPFKDIDEGVQIMLLTSQEGVIPVQLGPAWFIERQDIKIERKDRIEVTGSRASINGQPVIVASRIKKGDQVLVLRGKDGWPAWSGLSIRQ
jgi:hypothetical protein